MSDPQRIADAIRNSDRLAYRHYNEPTVHLYRECPEGKLIGIARRDSVTASDKSALAGLELCGWCEAKAKSDRLE